MLFIIALLLSARWGNPSAQTSIASADYGN